MFKMFSKKTKKETYKIVFCDTNDLTTKFGEYETYETYEERERR